MKSFIIHTFILLIMFNGALFSRVVSSFDLSGVTTYVWRGVKQFNGPALQGTATLIHKYVRTGLWVSSVNFDGNKEIETDPFVALNISVKNIEINTGVTFYSYDLFESFNDNADYEIEMFTDISYRILKLALFYVPPQASTKNNLNRSDYWLEASVEQRVSSLIFNMVYGYGTYSSKFLASPKKEAVANLVVGLKKNLTENYAVSWNFSKGFNGVEKVFWVGFHFYP
ncbi:hypothetical protein ACX8XN_18045 [Calditrichota bacterium GD2]